MLEGGFRLGECVAVRELSVSQLCRVELVRNINDDRLYVRREYSIDRMELLEKLRNTNCSDFPKIYVIIQRAGKRTTVIEEYIEGKTLLELLAERDFSAKSIGDLAEQLFSALGELHKNKIVHGDIKPANIIFTDGGKLKLIDFGISKLVGEGTSCQVDYLGTMGYAAPEQFTVDKTDVRTDIYSAGVTLTKAIEISGYRGYISKVAEKCINCNPDERFQNVYEIKDYMNKHNAIKRVIPVLCGAAAAVAAVVAVIFFFI